MSTGTADQRAMARATQSILKGASAQLAGKKRGRDIGEGRRVPRRQSYEVSDPQARPWMRIGDGSVAQGLVHCEALLKTAEELYHQDWAELPNSTVREAREKHADFSAELEKLLDQPDPPTGLPSQLRRELGRLEGILKRASLRLRLVDLRVLTILLFKCGINFQTGELYPAIETIAEKAGCHRNSVVAALRRLKAHGIVSWVRRTVRTSNEGEFAPQLEQTSNAYHFEHRQKMAEPVWQRYLQLLTAKMRRLGRIPKNLAKAPEKAPQVQDPEMAATLARIETSIGNAST